MAELAGKWLQVFQPKSGAKARLVCFHHSGGAAQFYKPWDKFLPPEVELCAVQLPGRGTRMDEEPLTDLGKVLDEVDSRLSFLFDKPVFLLGNSFGSIVAFAWMRRLRKEGRPLPVRFYILSCIAPHIDAPDLDFVEEGGKFSLENIQKAYGGLPDVLLKDKQFAEMVAKILLADIRLIRNSRYVDEPPIAVPFTAYGGEEDGRVSSLALEDWRKHTSAAFRSMRFPGAHFFLDKSMEPFMRDFVCELREELARL